MELGTFSLHCDQEPTSTISRNQYSEDQSYAERDDVYDPPQDILDTCNRDLEELRLKVLKTSVRCHMLEVDLATQFNPRNQQLYVDAQEACKQCTEAVRATHESVLKLIDSEAASKPLQEATESTGLIENQNVHEGVSEGKSERGQYQCVNEISGPNQY